MKKRVFVEVAMKVTIYLKMIMKKLVVNIAALT